MTFGARYCLCVVTGFCLVAPVTTASVNCNTDDIVHATLATNCTALPGESCDFTCDYGYERKTEIGILTCTWRTGTWNHHLSSLCRARDGFIVVKEYSATNTDRDIYIIPLYDHDNIGAIKVVDLPDDADAGGVIYDGYRRSIIWAEGGVINMVSVDDGSVSTLIDLSSGYFALNSVVDLAMDTVAGDVYFVGNRLSGTGSPTKRGFVGVIDTSGMATELSYVGTDTFIDLALDPVHRLIFPVIKVIGGTYIIKRLDFNGTDLGVVKQHFANFVCLAVDIIGEKFFPEQIGESVFWSDGNKFYKVDHNNDQSIFYYPPVFVKDVKVVDGYLYYIDSINSAITKVNSTDTSDVTTLQPTTGLFNMAYLDVPTLYGPSKATPTSSSTTLTRANLLSIKDPKITMTPNNTQKGISIMSKPPPYISSPVTLSTELTTEKSTTSAKNTAVKTMKIGIGDTTILADTMTPEVADTGTSKTISTKSALNTKISTSYTGSVIIPTAFQQCVCTGDTFIEEPAILVVIGFIAGVMVTLFCVLLVTWVQRCKTRQENRRVAASEAASRT